MRARFRAYQATTDVRTQICVYEYKAHVRCWCHVSVMLVHIRTGHDSLCRCSSDLSHLETLPHIFCRAQEQSADCRLQRCNQRIKCKNIHETEKTMHQQGNQTQFTQSRDSLPSRGSVPAYILLALCLLANYRRECNTIALYIHN